MTFAPARIFAHQLRWELRKLWARPRTYTGFAACLLFQLLLVVLVQMPTVRELMLRALWKTRLDLAPTLSGLTMAVHMMAETSALMGSLFVALVAGDITAREVEDGTLRMVLARPVSRGAVLAQKLLACVVYSLALTVFIALSALTIGLLIEGPGTLVVVSIRESVVAALDFATGLERYALAVPMLAMSMLTVTFLAFALSCCPVKAGTATVIAFAILLADHLIRVDPGLATVSPYTVTTRLLTWRQVFNDDVQWLRVQRNYWFLLRLDAALVLIAWWAFRRREFRP